jgi:branched-chain amino acid transport system permease protein
VGTFDIIIQQIANSLILGSFYGLVALGYSMVYGIIKLLNFAHGDIYMVGAFIGFTALSLLGGFLGDGWLGITVSMVLAMIGTGFLGMLIMRVAYRPMLSAPRLSILITAMGVSLVLFNSVMAATTGEYKAFNTGLDYEGIDLGSLHISYTQIILVLATAALMVALTLFINKTIWGKAMRAISIDMDACKLMGVDVNKIIGLTFFVGSALAAAAGVMAGTYYGSIHFFMGFLIGLKAFTAAVLGGIGIIPGAMLGGILLGFLESFGTQIPWIGTEWKDVFSFGVLILILLFRPNGLLGRTTIERM